MKRKYASLSVTEKQKYIDKVKQRRSSNNVAATTSGVGKKNINLYPAKKSKGTLSWLLNQEGEDKMESPPQMISNLLQ